MAKKIQVNAAIIIIGNEILSGRTQDTNTSTIALWLNSLGVKVQEVRVIPDIEEVIVKTINEVRKKIPMYLLLVELDQLMMILQPCQYLRPLD